MPARNEASRIETTLQQYADVFDDSEIIVVVNGCTDDTYDRVVRIARDHPNVRWVRIDRCVGKGGAVRAGFLTAAAPLVGFADADGSTPAHELRRLFEAVGDADGVVGSRWMPGARVPRRQPLVRRIASRIFNGLVRGFFGLPYSDTQCGAKVFRASMLQRVVTHLETANMAFDVDLLLALKDAHANIREVPTLWLDVASAGFTLVPTSLRMLTALLRLRMRRSFFRIFIPVFDHLVPTTPMRAHDGFAILVLNWRDPTNPQAGGAEAYLFEMAKRWVAGGHRVSWLSASYPGAARESVIDGIPITRVGTALSVYARLPLEYLRNFRDRFDVIVDAENGIPFFSPLFSMKPKICVVHHVHQGVLKRHLRFPLSTMLAWAERRLMPRLYRDDRFVAVSRDTCRAMERELGIPASKVEVIPNGVDERLVPGEKAAYPMVLALGRLKRYKRGDLILEAFARVRKNVPGAVLHVAGDGDDRARLERIARDAGVADAVVFEGHVSFERKRELLQQAWVYVVASEIEGWGVGVIEAAACGTPAVAFAVPGLREAIVDGMTGVLVPEGADLAEPLRWLLGDASLRTRLGAAAIARARAFSWDASAEAMLDVIARQTIGQYYGFVRKDGRWALAGSGLAHVDLSAVSAPSIAPSP
ncbi:MAG: glycosyltransferase [Candidatus Tyrphobacter sp.]